MANQGPSKRLQFPGLGFDEREDFFSRLLQLPQTTDPMVPAAVSGEPGWIILNGDLARAILNSPDAVKGRTRESQARAGGFAAADEDQLLLRRRTIMVALAAASDDLLGMQNHTVSVCRRLGGSDVPALPPEDQRAAALSEAMVNHLLGVDPLIGLPPKLLSGEIQKLSLGVEHSTAGTRPDVVRARRQDFVDLMDVAPSAFLDNLFCAGWSRAEIVDEVLALALAGWESTAAAVTSGFSLDVQSAGSHSHVRELLRLYPPSWLLVRKCSREIHGWNFRPEEWLIISPWLIQRSEIAWRSPSDFIPARFTPYSPQPWYFPFGAGPRRCPGERYALAHIKICLETLVDPVTNVWRPRRVGLLGRRSSALISN